MGWARVWMGSGAKLVPHHRLLARRRLFWLKFFMENPMAKTGKERRKLESNILSSIESGSHEHEDEDDTKNAARDRSA